MTGLYKNIIIVFFVLFYISTPVSAQVKIAADTSKSKTTNTASTIVGLKYSATDTIVTAAIQYNGEYITYRSLEEVRLLTRLTAAQIRANEAWTRLRNAVYVTYPYAKRASLVINDINAHLSQITNEEARKQYLKSRERELRKEFTQPLTSLSIYQGKILMKLINRETGNSCYGLVKEYKGSLTAMLYQTVAFFFETSLKQSYDPSGDDREIERITQQLEKLYGYRS